MACPKCKQRLNRMLQPQVAAVPRSSTLSAATLTGLGWVKTCYVCGTQTKPAPFPERCEQTCSCVPQ